jgi:hypothetical protein
VLALPIAAALMARRNLRSGRADRTGAMRLTGAVFAISMLAWLVQPHVENLDVETGRFFIGIAMALFNGSLLGVVVGLWRSVDQGSVSRGFRARQR